MGSKHQPYRQNLCLWNWFSRFDLNYVNKKLSSLNKFIIRHFPPVFSFAITVQVSGIF